MVWIIITGILTLGVIPLLSAMGYGVELLANLFTAVEWTYWPRAAVALAILATAAACAAIRSARK